MLLPDKQHFRIGEVAEIVGVKPHVLRYWESEFRILSPLKTRGSHRQYSRRDVEIAVRIKELVHDRGFTVAGARRHLKEVGEHKRATAAPHAAKEIALRSELLAIRDLLTEHLAALDAEPPSEAPAQVVVQKVIPAPKAGRR